MRTAVSTSWFSEDSEVETVSNFVDENVKKIDVSVDLRF